MNTSAGVACRGVCSQSRRASLLVAEGALVKYVDGIFKHLAALRRYFPIENVLNGSKRVAERALNETEVAADASGVSELHTEKKRTFLS